MGNKPRSNRQQPKQGTRPRPAAPDPSKTPWLRYGAIGAGVVGVVVLLAFAFSGLAPTEEPSGIVDFPGLTRNHVEGPITYAQDPPVGGDHAPIWLNCGYYDTPIPNENAVHSLEHGVVWLAFDPSLSADEVETLRDFAQETEVLVAPYPGLAEDVVATVWGRQLRVSEFDEDTIKAFIVTQKNGPGTPEPGADCTRGIGQPSA